MYNVLSMRAQYRSEGKRIADLAKFFGCSWSTVERLLSLSDEELERRGKRNRPSRVTTKAVLESVRLMIADEQRRQVPKKQRATVRAMFKRLVEEGMYHGSERQLEYLVKKERMGLAIDQAPSFLPLTHQLGSQAQLDHGEAEIELAGVHTLVYLFCLAVPGHSLRYCQLFPLKAQEAWGEFLERAFTFFGGIFPRIVVDNDGALKVRSKETEFSLRLRAHYGFALHFCNRAAGWEKGAVENSVGYCRRNFLCGIPSTPSFAAINEQLAHTCRKEIDSDGNKRTIASELAGLLSPCLPKKTWCRRIATTVSSQQLVRVDKHDYSVPTAYVGAHVEVKLAVDKVAVVLDGSLIAEHSRFIGEPAIHIELFHYLDQLQRKPNAAPDFALTHKDSLPALYQQLLEALMRRFEPKAAVQEWIAIAKLRSTLPSACVDDTVRLLLTEGTANKASVTYLATQFAHPEPRSQTGEILCAQAAALMPQQLPPFDLSCFNRLLGGALC